MKKTENLARFALLSIVAAIVTLMLKFTAYYLTGSVGLLSDAIESVVNLLAAGITMWMLNISARPPDEDHAYGHTKAEYFASVLEGVFIFLAAAGIALAAVNRLLKPQDVSEPWVGIAFSSIASMVNGGVAFYLLGMAKKHRSLALEADAHHLMTDVWTSVGVVVCLIIVALTGLKILDPIIAILVALNIVATGIDLMKRSIAGLMDTSLSKSDIKKIKSVLNEYEKEGVIFHALKSRISGTNAFASVHMLLPGSWTIQNGHDMAEQLEQKMRVAVPGLSFITHIEPKEDEKSFKDMG